MKKENLDLLEKCDYISIDTSVLMETSDLESFIDTYALEIMACYHHIFIYDEVLKELKYHMAGTNEEKRRKAGAALDIINKRSDLFLCESQPEKVRAKNHRDRIADQRFLSALHFYHTTHSQLFITNDKKLQADLATAAKTASVNGKPVYVASIENGLLKRFELPEPEISYEPSYESGDNSAICLIGGLFLGVVVTTLTSIIKNKLS